MMPGGPPERGRHREGYTGQKSLGLRGNPTKWSIGVAFRMLWVCGFGASTRRWRIARLLRPAGVLSRSGATVPTHRARLPTFGTASFHGG